MKEKNAPHTQSSFLAVRSSGVVCSRTAVEVSTNQRMPQLEEPQDARRA